MILMRNKINALQAVRFKLATITMHAKNARMLIMSFYHPEINTRVKVLVSYKQHCNACSAGAWYPTFKITTLDNGYEILGPAKETFENKAIMFINSNSLQYTGRELTNGESD